MHQETLKVNGPGSKGVGTASQPCEVLIGITFPASAAREEAA
ncbi:MAG: hypothetical protein ACYDAA_02655 [Syntrophales bacterium]